MSCPECGTTLIYNSVLKILFKCPKCGSLFTGIDLAELSEPIKEKVILT